MKYYKISLGFAVVITALQSSAQQRTIIGEFKDGRKVTVTIYKEDPDGGSKLFIAASPLIGGLKSNVGFLGVLDATYTPIKEVAFRVKYEGLFLLQSDIVKDYPKQKPFSMELGGTYNFITTDNLTKSTIKLSSTVAMSTRIMKRSQLGINLGMAPLKNYGQIATSYDSTAAANGQDPTKYSVYSAFAPNFNFGLSYTRRYYAVFNSTINEAMHYWDLYSRFYADMLLSGSTAFKAITPGFDLSKQNLQKNNFGYRIGLEFYKPMKKLGSFRLGAELAHYPTAENGLGINSGSINMGFGIRLLNSNKDMN